jgi:hypothetical protein
MHGLPAPMHQLTPGVAVAAPFHLRVGQSQYVEGPLQPIGYRHPVPLKAAEGIREGLRSPASWHVRHGLPPL